MGRYIPKPEIVVVEAIREDGSTWTDAFNDLVEAQTACNERRWSHGRAYVWWDIIGNRLQMVDLQGCFAAGPVSA